MEWVYVIVCVVVDIPIVYYLTRFLFPDGGLGDALVFLITPDMWSALRGKFWGDMWAEIKLGALVFLVGGLLAGEAYLAVSVLGLELPFSLGFLPV